MSIKTKTAFILLPIFIPLIIFGNKLSLFLLCFLAIILGLYEFFNLVIPKERKFDKWFAIILGGISNILLFLGGHLIALNLISFLVIVIFISYLIKESEFSKVIELSGKIILGIIYISFLGAHVFLLEDIQTEFHFNAPILAFILTWSTDSFGYIIGKRLGKIKIVSKISPKKTLEGYIGGVLITIIIMILSSLTFAKFFSIYESILVGLLASIFCFLGDLFESMLKRGLDIKDTGKILPGHGGILDRIDSILLVAPFLYYYIKYRGIILALF